MVVRAQPCFLLTVDVEDWFQVENFKPWIAFSDWASFGTRVERNVHRLLDLFDSAGKVAATFFTLGWVAERMPGMVREIAARGHEVASHGHRHRLCTRLSPTELFEDLSASKRRLEDIIGGAVQGFRAPSFSINDAVLEQVAEAGYRYDSSYNSFAWHGRYGRIAVNGRPRSGWALQLKERFFELPVSNLVLGLPGGGDASGKGFILPWGGGAYFRLIPPALYIRGVRSMLERFSAFLFYLHPWEIDPDQPRMRQAGIGRRLRHYTNLRTTLQRLSGLIGRLRRCRFLTCRDYLDAQFDH
jgi:polysaccharide deacetylase family protein (PEP-CTERM system associated)